MAVEIDKIISILKRECKKYREPIVTEVSFSKDTFKVLISCLLSLRTKDEVTRVASERLFKRAGDVRKLSKLNIKEIERLIYPVGFYKTKAKRIKDICNKLIKEHKGEVPNEMDELLKFKGVGRKTAAITRVYGFNKNDVIAVDVHVHVIANRLEWVKTKNAEQTEYKLRELLPKKYWIIINDLFVVYGQNVCRTIYPKCGKCVVENYCVYDKRDLGRV